MRKNHLILSLILALALVLSACGNGSGNAETTAPATDSTATVTEAHDHVFTRWERDAENHWYVCECGETVQEPHNLDEYGYCDACSGTISFYEDGMYEILTYDDWGTMDACIVYDAEGNVISDYRYIYEYYEDGNPSHFREYHEGVLCYESTYLRCENPEFAQVYTSEEIHYNTDDKMIITYSESEHIQNVRVYDYEDNLLFEEIYEYEFDENGNQLSAKCYRDGELVMEEHAFVGPDGNTHTSSYVSYTDGVSDYAVIYDYEFADNGEVCYYSITINGIKDSESFYEADADGWYYPAHEMEYSDEGVIEYECFYEMADSMRYTAREIYYDENGQIAEEYRYDADGNVIGE